MNKLINIFLALLILFVSACSSVPKNTSNSCSIFNERYLWYKHAKKTEEKWGTPIYLQLAIIKMESDFDKIVVVSASARVQKERVLSRNTMDIKLLNIIKSKQISDEEKKSRADFVFETTSIERTKKDVKEFLKEVGISNA